MQLFYAPDIVPPLHTLNEEESKHCIRVLRLQCGGRIHLSLIHISEPTRP